MIERLLFFAAVFVASLLLTRVVLWGLRRRAILDHPNDRSSHSVAVPRGGGLAVTAVLAGVWAWGLWWRGEEIASFLPLAALLLLAAVSWLDDLRDLPFWLRLGVQFTAVGLALPWVLTDGGVTGGLVPLWLEVAVICLSWVGFINFFNFMDGIDGISGVEAVGIGLGFIGLAHVASLPAGIIELAPVIAAASLGFLCWNWHPAKIFLGDVGSVPLGFVLGGLLWMLAGAGLWAAALILPLYYLADAGLTLLKRATRGQKFWQAHREHCYQIAVQRGHSHARVSTAIAITNLLLITLAFWSVERPFAALAAACVLVLVLMAWMVRSGGRAGDAP